MGTELLPPPRWVPKSPELEGRCQAGPMGPGWVAGQPPGRTKAATAASSCQHRYVSMKPGPPRHACCLSSLPGLCSPSWPKTVPLSVLFLSCLLLMLTSSHMPAFSNPCQIETITPPHADHSGHETNPAHFRLGARMWALHPVPRKPSLAAIGNNYWEPAWGHCLAAE